LSPRFSWITSTPPRGEAAAAHAAISDPFGPENVIASVAAGAHVDARGPLGCVCAGLACDTGAFSSAVATAPLSPNRPSRRIASRRVMMPS
jgi:hypothetical protein